MSVPDGMKRIILAGGRRHGQWCDVPADLPYDWSVRHPPEPFRFDKLADEPTKVPLPPDDRYYRTKVVGLPERGTHEVIVYATSGGLDLEVTKSAVHLAYCGGHLETCREPKWHREEWRS